LTPTHIVVSPTTALVDVGNTQVLSAQVLDGTNHVIPAGLVHWALSDPSAATLETPSYFAATATVRGITAPVTVTATTLGGLAASATLSVRTAGTRFFDSFTAPYGTPLLS